jgi:hypothetical protein
MPRPVPSPYVPDPAMPVLLRSDGAVQVGWDPRRAVLVRPPCGLTAAELATRPVGLDSRTRPWAAVRPACGGVALLGDPDDRHGSVLRLAKIPADLLARIEEIAADLAEDDDTASWVWSASPDLSTRLAG